MLERTAERERPHARRPAPHVQLAPTTVAVAPSRPVVGGLLARELARELEQVRMGPFPGTVPVIDGVDGRIVTIVDGRGKRHAVTMYEFAWGPWRPGTRTNPLVAGSNAAYREAWHRIVQAHGMATKGDVVEDFGVSAELRDAPAAATAGERVGAWLAAHRELIADAERRFRVDRRAIAGAIAWEALENVRGGAALTLGRFVGPGKVHIKEWSSVPSAVATGHTLAEEVEDAGLVSGRDLPADKRLSTRMTRLATPAGAIEYTAAGMRLATDIAAEFGADISGDVAMLTWFHQSKTGASFRAYLEQKAKTTPAGTKMTFDPQDRMNLWVMANVAYLEHAVGQPQLHPAAAAAPAPAAATAPTAELRAAAQRAALVLSGMAADADRQGALRIVLTLTRSGDAVLPGFRKEPERSAPPPPERGPLTPARVAAIFAPFLRAWSMADGARLEVVLVRDAAGWRESVSTVALAPATKILRQAADDVAVTYGAHADEHAMTPAALAILKDVLRAAGLKSATISSTARTAADQARAMYSNLEGTGPGKGVEATRALYGKRGNEVIDVYVAHKDKGEDAAAIRKAMQEKIESLPRSAFPHLADPAKLTVFDVGPKSIDDPDAFQKAAEAEVGKRVTTFLAPPRDPAFHFEIAVE